MEDNGWTVSEGLEEEFFTSGRFEGLNIRELDEEMKGIFDKYGLEMVRKTLRNGDEIDFVGKLPGSKRPDVIVIRRFSVSDYKDVKHMLMEIKPALQGKGISKDITKVWYKQYKKMGLEEIKVGANLDVGGYTWGRYGYSQYADERGMKKWLGFQDTSPVIKNAANNIIEAYYKEFPNAYEFPMNLLADDVIGKELLLGSDWEGFLKMNNKVQRDIFEEYLYGKR